MHVRNRHQGRYDFSALCKTCPELLPFVKRNDFAERDPETIDFSDAEAVKMLNRALLKHFYGIQEWDIPANYLCPPIPGRADYLHTVADLLAEAKVAPLSGNSSTATSTAASAAGIPCGNSIRVLDVGVGANCIYPILGHAEYGWSFVGTDIDSVALASAKKIVQQNKSLQDSVELRLQSSPAHFFKGVVKAGEKFALSICNPPFHASLAEAQAGTTRKWKNLGKKTDTKNFGGQNSELWCPGGEAVFIEKMIKESAETPETCEWFTTLVSKQTTLDSIEHQLHRANARSLRLLEMSQGQKKSRLVAWSFVR